MRNFDNPAGGAFCPRRGKHLTPAQRPRHLRSLTPSALSHLPRTRIRCASSNELPRFVHERTRQAVACPRKCRRRASPPPTAHERHFRPPAPAELAKPQSVFRGWLPHRYRACLRGVYVPCSRLGGPVRLGLRRSHVSVLLGSEHGQCTLPPFGSPPERVDVVRLSRLGLSSLKLSPSLCCQN